MKRKVVSVLCAAGMAAWGETCIVNDNHAAAVIGEGEVAIEAFVFGSVGTSESAPGGVDASVFTQDEADGKVDFRKPQGLFIYFR